MPVKITCFALCCLVLSFSFMQAQTSNPCGVKAILSPAGDSVIHSPTAVNFKSASVNATDYKILIDLYDLGMNTPVNWSISTGLTTVKLVAYKGTCTDTAVAYYFNPGQFPSVTDNARRLYGIWGRGHEITGLISKSTGGHLIAGHSVSSSYFNERQQGLLIKTKEEGCVEWGRKLLSVYGSDIHMVKEASDGGYFVLAQNDLIRECIIKLDAAGNLQWKKTLVVSIPDGTEYNVIATGIEPLPDGGLTMVGKYPLAPKSVVLRLDKNGDFLWQREYGYNSPVTEPLSNLLVKDNYLYIGGSVNYDPFPNYAAFISKLDLSTGQIIWTKKYTAPNGAVILKEILSPDNNLLVNIITPTGQSNLPVIAGFMRIDPSGNVLSASLVADKYTANNLVGPYSAGNTHLIQSGKSFYIISPGSESLSLQPGISYSTKLVKIDPNYNVLWTQNTGGAGVPRFFYNASAPKEGLATGGNEIGATVSPNILGTYLSLKVADSAGGNPAANCFFGKQAFAVLPVGITAQPISWTDLPSNYVAKDKELVFAPFYPEMRFKCPDYVDSCSYLKLEGVQSICNLNQDYTYKTHKNKGCGQPTQWTIPAGAQTILKTDSSVTLRFSGFGRYVIYGTNPLSCTPVQDSMVVIAASKTPPLNLGPDQQICPQNTTILHAGKGYLLYEWQDGSTDSLFKANQPGQYWVKVTDSCNNVLRDTLLVSLAPPIPFSLGADRAKCNNDTVRLQAPAGFLNYSWSPAYSISSTSGQQTIARPAVDTQYSVIAEKTPGCFAYDTVKVFVHYSPSINLGTDTSFCSGDSVVLNAGAGFQQYTWSNGAITRQLPVFSAGTYSVMASTTDGCKSYDTLKVVAVFNKPVADIGDDSLLCVGSSRVLNAGIFSRYLWQDGSTGSSFSVTALGTYYVKVTDSHQCMGSDTIVVNILAPLPSKFLPPDTSVCAYGGKLELKPAHVYNAYQWSNGNTAATITVGQPGTYWLQATDANNCSGRDSIVIHLKDCLTGFFAPSAFSPNRDGKNDIFKPLLFGNIKKYRFSVYNRWAQRIFDTADPAIGWDGSNSGHTQDNTVFIWVCTYQFDGQEQKTEKGTVTLIK